MGAAALRGIVWSSRPSEKPSVAVHVAAAVPEVPNLARRGSFVSTRTTVTSRSWRRAVETRGQYVAPDPGTPTPGPGLAPIGHRTSPSATAPPTPPLPPRTGSRGTGGSRAKKAWCPCGDPAQAPDPPPVPGVQSHGNDWENGGWSLGWCSWHRCRCTGERGGGGEGGGGGGKDERREGRWQRTASTRGRAGVGRVSGMPGTRDGAHASNRHRSGLGREPLSLLGSSLRTRSHRLLKSRFDHLGRSRVKHEPY